MVAKVRYGYLFCVLDYFCFGRQHGFKVISHIYIAYLAVHNLWVSPARTHARAHRKHAQFALIFELCQLKNGYRLI